MAYMELAGSQDPTRRGGQENGAGTKGDKEGGERGAAMRVGLGEPRRYAIVYTASSAIKRIVETESSTQTA